MVRVTCYLDRTGRAKKFLLTRQGVLQAICDAGQYANLFGGTAFLQELQQADFWQSRPRLLPLDEVVLVVHSAGRAITRLPAATVRVIRR